MSASISPNLDQITDSGVYPAVLALVGRPYFPTIGLFGWLRAAFLPDGIRVVLLEDFVFEYKGATYTIPLGFISDFATVPDALWGILGPRGRYSVAAVCHDYFYWSGVVDKATADDALFDLSQSFGASWVNREELYEGVRLGGQAAWNHYRQLDDAIKTDHI
jgi:hypothetical protein